MKMGLGTRFATLEYQTFVLYVALGSMSSQPTSDMTQQ